MLDIVCMSSNQMLPQTAEVHIKETTPAMRKLTKAVSKAIFEVQEVEEDNSNNDDDDDNNNSSNSNNQVNPNNENATESTQCRCNQKTKSKSGKRQTESKKSSKQRLAAGAQLPQHGNAGFHCVHSNNMNANFNGNFVNSSTFGGAGAAAVPGAAGMTMAQWNCHGRYAGMPYVATSMLPRYAMMQQQMDLSKQYNLKQQQQHQQQQQKQLANNFPITNLPIPNWAKAAPDQYSNNNNSNNNSYVCMPNAAWHDETIMRTTAGGTHSLNRNNSDTNLNDSLAINMGNSQQDLQEYAQRERAKETKCVEKTREELEAQIKELQKRLSEKDASGKKFQYKQKARRMKEHWNGVSSNIIEARHYRSNGNVPSATKRRTKTLKNYVYPTAVPFAMLMAKKHEADVTTTAAAAAVAVPTVSQQISDRLAHRKLLRAKIKAKWSSSQLTVNRATSPITSTTFSGNTRKRSTKKRNSKAAQNGRAKTKTESIKELKLLEEPRSTTTAKTTEPKNEIVKSVKIKTQNTNANTKPMKMKMKDNIKSKSKVKRASQASLTSKISKFLNVTPAPPPTPLVSHSENSNEEPYWIFSKLNQTNSNLRNTSTLNINTNIVTKNKHERHVHYKDDAINPFEQKIIHHPEFLKALKKQK